MKRKLLITVFWTSLVLFITALAALGLWAGGERAKVLCDRLDVQIKDEHKFVTPEDVTELIIKRYGTYVGVRLDSLDLYRMEQLLEQKSVVEKSEAWTTPDGVLHVSVVQRKPVLRFMRNGQVYYIDRTGFIFPQHTDYVAEVPMIEGSIPSAGNPNWDKWVEGVLSLVEMLDGSKMWKDRLEGLSMNSAGDLELRLKDGSERFIIGFPDELAGKLERMGKYFTHIQPSKDQGYYKSVNLKFNKQIICRKDI